MKIIFLGTSGWYDTKIGQTPCVLLDTRDAYIIFDAGFGLAGVEKYITKDKPIYLFISHFHLDHICGLHVLPRFNFKQGLNILSFKGSKKLLGTLARHPFVVPFNEVNYPINIKEFTPGSYKLPINFTCLELKHADYTFGYRVEVEGKTVVYCSDTALCNNDELLAKDADVLIHECALLPGHELAWGHVNPEEAAGLSKISGVKKLFLTHFGPEYKNFERRKKAEVAARKIFKNTVAARDGMVVKIKKIKPGY